MSEERIRDAEEFVDSLVKAFEAVSLRLVRLEARVFGEDGPGSSDPGPSGPELGPGPLFDPGPALKEFQDLTAEADELRQHVKNIYATMEKLLETA